MSLYLKYMPQTVDQYYFVRGSQLEQTVNRYRRGITTTPLILHGPYGCGKSMLARLLPQAIYPSIPLLRDGKPDIFSAAGDYRVSKAAMDQMKNFARNAFSDNDPRVVVLDEVDRFGKAFMNELASEVDWLGARLKHYLLIMTTNHLDVIEGPLKSRSKALGVPTLSVSEMAPYAKRICDAEGLDLALLDVERVLRRGVTMSLDFREMFKRIEDLL